MIYIECYGTDSSQSPEILGMDDPEAAIDEARAKSHEYNYRTIVVLTDDSLTLAQFTGWLLWKPDSAHRHISEAFACGCRKTEDYEPLDAANR